MIIIDENQKEIELSIEEIDKITFYLKMEDRKRVDIEYIRDNTNNLAVIIINDAAELTDLFHKIGEELFKKGDNKVD